MQGGPPGETTTSTTLIGGTDRYDMISPKKVATKNGQL